MNGFSDTVNGFSLEAIQDLQTQAEDMYLGWIPNPNPSVENRIDITDQAVMTTYGETAPVADGVVDDTVVMKSIASNTAITNWYIPSGKIVRCVGVLPNINVTHIFGGGGIRRHFDGTSDGALMPWYTVVFDGITFDNEDGIYNGSASQGILLIMWNNPDKPEWSSDQMEIRNCIFDSSGNGNDCDAISVFTGYDPVDDYWDDVLGEPKPGYVPNWNDRNKHRNMKIYNNTFLNNPHFAMEIGDRNSEHLESQSGLDGLEIFNNEFIGGNGMSLSRIREGSTNVKVYNNTFTDMFWAVELACASGIHVYNNQMMGMKSNTLSEGGPGHTYGLYSEDYQFVTGTNYIYENHVEATGDGIYNYFSLHGACKSQYYENYIKQRVKDEYTEYAYTDADGADFYDNTVVAEDNTDYTWSVRWTGGYWNIDDENNKYWVPLKSGSITNNEIYVTKPNGYGISTGDGSVMTVSGNNIYEVGTTDCLLGEILTNPDGSCNKGYTGEIPTGRTGAGLSDPANIGPQ